MRLEIQESRFYIGMTGFQVECNDVSGVYRQSLINQVMVFMCVCYDSPSLNSSEYKIASIRLSKLRLSSPGAKRNPSMVTIRSRSSSY